MDENRNFHSQQDCPGCVDDEANIVNKCDARRQVVSGNEMFFLSKEWDGSISVLTAVYEDFLRGEQVDVLTAVYEGLLKGKQADVYTANSCGFGTSSGTRGKMKTRRTGRKTRSKSRRKKEKKGRREEINCTPT